MPPPAIGLATLLVLSLVIGWGVLVAATLRRLSRPSRRTYASALARGIPGDPSELPPDRGPWAWREWTFRTGGLDLPVWEIDGHDPKGPSIILTHGWGDSRIGGLSRVRALARAASRFYLWDMRGHGDAPGRTTLGIREADDLLALIDRVRTLHGGAPGIVLMGWSLGAGVSIGAATRRGDDVIGVLAENPYRSPITPARNVLRLSRLPHRSNLTPALAILGSRHGASAGWHSHAASDRAAWAARLVMPLLVVHGDRDDVSPPEDGRAIAAAAKRGEFLAIEGAGHTGLWTSPETADRVAQACRRFVTSCATHAAEAGTAGPNIRAS